MTFAAPAEKETFKPGPAARGIVIRQGSLLAMLRSKPGMEDYIVVPGGHIEDGESKEETVIREIGEETTVVVKNPRKVFHEDALDDQWGEQTVFLCEYVSGEPRLPEDSQEYQVQLAGGGRYVPFWLPLDRFGDFISRFKSPLLAAAIEYAIEAGFPDEPVHLNTTTVW